MSSYFENFDSDVLKNRERQTSIFLSDKERAEVRLFFSNRLAGLEPEQEADARRQIGARNIIDFSDLCDVGFERLFTNDELVDFEWTLLLETYADNLDAVEAAREVRKKQREFADAALVKKKPANIREVESVLRDAGFSNREARRVALSGYQKK